MKFAILLFGSFWAFISGYGVIKQHTYAPSTYRASRGQAAVLPCGLETVSVAEAGSSVRWIRDNGEVIYKYPDLNYSRMLVLEHNFTRKCIGDLCPDNTWLLIEHVQPSDAGSYQCRVHMQGLPTTDFTIEIVVVDSPGMPAIYNESGMEIKDIVGPLRVGEDLALKCEVPEDHAESTVWWERNGVTMRDSEYSVGKRRAILTRFNIGRDEHNAQYKCFSQNADISDPLATSIVVKMILMPLLVEIRYNQDENFKENEPRVVDCVVFGSMPPPTVTWSLDGVPLKSNIHTEHHEGNYTVSSLTLVPTMKNHGSNLTCKGMNYLMPENYFEDIITLKVEFRPVCMYKEPPTIGIFDDDQDAAICMVKAFPEPKSFLWEFSYRRSIIATTFAKKMVNGKPDVYAAAYTFTGVKPKYPGYVQLLTCAAINALGKQENPCRFAVRQGRLPLKPSCDMIAHPPDTIVVNCTKVWDGGREATYHLEVHNWDENVTKTYTEKKAYFKIKEQTDSNISALVYGTSSYGRGESAVLTLSVRSLDTEGNELVPNVQIVNYWWKITVLTVMSGFGVLILAQCLNIIIQQIRWPEGSSRFDGLFHREPDFPVLTREERFRTNITVNPGAGCPVVTYNPEPSPNGTCRVLMGCHGGSTVSVAPERTQRQAFYV